MCTAARSISCGIWEVTDCVLEIFFDCSLDRSSMFMKSMFPPKLSWYVRFSFTPRSSKSFVRTRCVMVAPTWLLMSSPTIGTPAARNFSAHSGSVAMKTGSALTKPTPASRAHCA